MDRAELPAQGGGCPQRGIAMSHFFTFATNANGIVSDGYLNDEIGKAISSPFGLSTVYIYSHGWWNNSTAAANCYNRFSIGLANTILASWRALGAGAAPAGSLNAGIHWPSTVSEDSGPVEQLLQPASFFTMETRADDVGETGVNGLLISVLQQWQSQQREGALTLNLIGHSFGCKVVCAALQKLVAVRAATPAMFTNARFNVVLLEAAFDDDDFESNQLYADVVTLPNLRVLVSKSALDSALGKFYPLAHLLEFFKKTDRTAMGFAGPTQSTIDRFGGADSVSVTPGANFPVQAAFTKKLVVADLTPLHAANPGGAELGGGHHSDIYYDEIYGLIARFL
jgi:hypothetical protein